MPSSLTINVSAGASSILPSVKPAEGIAPVAGRASDLSQGQLAKLSEDAAIRTSTKLTPKLEDPRIQKRSRTEPNYGPTKKKKRKGQTDEEQSETDEEGGSKLDLKA